MQKRTPFVYTRLGFESFCRQISKTLKCKDDLVCPMIRKLSSVYALAHSGFVIRCCPMADSHLILALLFLHILFPRVSYMSSYNRTKNGVGHSLDCS